MTRVKGKLFSSYTWYSVVW